MGENVKCTKPHCDCIAIAEMKNGGHPVKGYPCLADHPELAEMKSGIIPEAVTPRLNMESKTAEDVLREELALHRKEYMFSIPEIYIPDIEQAMHTFAEQEAGKVVEICKEQLLKQLLPMFHSNGYPSEAVTKSVILGLDRLVASELNKIFHAENNQMSYFQQYRRKQIAELRTVTQQDIDEFKTRGFVVAHETKDSVIEVSISDVDKQSGSPKFGDMIARNPKNHLDQWLVAEQYFNDNFEAA